MTPLLETLRAETAASVDEVRRIVADLRPPERRRRGAGPAAAAAGRG